MDTFIGDIVCLFSFCVTWGQELHQPGDGVQAVASQPNVAHLALGLHLEERGQRKVSELTEVMTKLDIVNLDG